MEKGVRERQLDEINVIQREERGRGDTRREGGVALGQRGVRERVKRRGREGAGEWRRRPGEALCCANRKSLFLIEIQETVST